MKPSYVSLHNHGHHSMLDGYSTPDEYIEAAVKLGHKGLGLSDHGNLHGVYSFINNARKNGIIPTPGCEFYVAPINPDGAQRIAPVFYGPGGKKASKFDVSSNGAYLHLTVWAYNNVGLMNLFKLSTMSNNPLHFYQKPRIDFDMLANHSEGLVVSTGCPSSEISTRFLLDQDDRAYEYAGRLKDIFGDRLFVEIMDHNMNIELERDLLPKQLLLSKKMGLPLLATNDCHYAHKQNHTAHEEMLCVQSGARMSDETYDNGGPRFAFTGSEYYLKTAEQMAEIFPQRDFPDALINSVAISEMSSDISIDFNPNLKPKPHVPEEFDDEVHYYKHLIQEGYKERYGNAPIEVRQEAVARNKKEFKVIHSSDFIGYMLVVRDYLAWTRKNYSTRDTAGDILALPLGGGRGCFLPGNKVKIGETYENIENIKSLIANNPYLTMLTHDGTSQKIEDTFEYDVTNEDCVEITLSNGNVISSTSDHRIFHKNKGFIEAGMFEVGDEMIGPKSESDSQKLVLVGSNAINAEETDYKERMITMFEEISQKDDYSIERHSYDNNSHYIEPKRLERLIAQGRRGFEKGVFKSGKQINKLIRYDSAHELKLINALENDSNVVFFNRCNDIITYTFENQQYLHFPLFKVEMQDGSYKVIEIKSMAEHSVNVAKAEEQASKAFYARQGISYEVMLNEELEQRLNSSHDTYTVVGVKHFKYTGKVYDLSVENVRNYTVADVTVHNSVGGSIHAYELGISEVDPIKHDLIFERFLSEGRGATYRIGYDDGTFEEIVVSGTKIVDNESRYIHQLQLGDEVTFEENIELELNEDEGAK